MEKQNNNLEVKYKDFADRLVKAMQHAGIGLTELSEKTKINYEMIRRYSKGYMKPRDEGMQKLAEILNVSLAWLITGEMTEKNKEVFKNQDIITIGQIDITASCGKGVANLYDYPEIVRSIDFKIEQVKHLFSKLQAEHTKLISTDGDSMHPKIPKGATVFIDVSKNYFCGDGIYLFFYRGDLYLKRLQKTPEGLFAISDNEKYKPFYIQEEYIHEFNIVARYVGILNVAID